MSQERQIQWKRRFDRLHTLRERLAARGHYDRAQKAYLLIQAGIDRWSKRGVLGQAGLVRPASVGCGFALPDTLLPPIIAVPEPL